MDQHVTSSLGAPDHHPIIGRPHAGGADAAGPSVPVGRPLHPAVFVDRPNRFVIRVRLGRSDLVRAHLPDPGRLRELLLPGVTVWVRAAAGTARKTRWSAVLVQTPDGRGLVSLDTHLPNRLVARAISERFIDELAEWQLVRREVKVGASRFDFLLSNARGSRFLLEVKSVTLVEDGIARFPDAVTVRGTRHLRELAERRIEGWETGVLFVLQRGDAHRIEAARSIDPDFADALVQARDAGVRILGRRCDVTREAVGLRGAISVG